MKKLMFMVALAVSSTAFAAEVKLGQAVFGYNPTGVVNASVVDNAKVENDILHAPQYMPNYPTAATIWPRVVEVPCTETKAGDLDCTGYSWSPALGRGEYLFITPKVVEPVEPQIVTVEKIREVFVEVPVKKKKE